MLYTHKTEKPLDFFKIIYFSVYFLQAKLFKKQINSTKLTWPNKTLTKLKSSCEDFSKSLFFLEDFGIFEEKIHKYKREVK